MIDIHHHLLFGLDDGAKDIETSVAMAEAAAADGITHIVCTPHANERFPFDPEVNREKLAQIQERIYPTVGDRLTIGLGCDFHLSYDNIEDAVAHPTRYTLNGRNYLLVEFSEYGIPANMDEVFYELTVSGMIPIITHPERSQQVRRVPEKLADWLRAGCLIQVTAASLSGRFGKTAEAFALELLRKRWVHFIATDAHNMGSRPPIMSVAHAWLVNNYGQETADRLCIHNPRAAFYGEELPFQPEAEGLYADQTPKRGFFSRLFGKG